MAKSKSTPVDKIPPRSPRKHKPRKPGQTYKGPKIPMSESVEKQKYEATAQDCINDLRRIALIDVTKVISRNYYRNNGKYAESVWNRFFGTFNEFKRQAGIVLTRQQHQLEKEVAKHAAHDHYRELNVERAKYAENYVRNNKSRFQLLLGVCDVHDTEADPFTLRVLIDTVKRTQPDIICFDGDLFDLPQFGKYTQDPRCWDIVERIKFVHEKVLAPMREAAPDAQLDLIEGNHEFRLMRHLADATPAMKTLLSDLHGMTVPKLLGLDKYEVNYVARADLAAYRQVDINKEIGRNFKTYYNSLVAHHYPEGQALGMPGFCGHHHKHVCWAHTSAVYGAYEFHQCGSIHRRSASYTDGEKWSNGFIMAHVDTQKQDTCFEYVDVRNHAVVGGKYYHREESEV